MEKNQPSTVVPRQARFPETLWSIVLAAAGDDSSSARVERAFSSLCQVYWYPVYAHLRRQGYAPHDAQDLTQGFFAHLLQPQKLRGVGPEKGRFRSFLLASLRNFSRDERDKAQAQKRGGGVAIVSLDAAGAEERLALEPSTPTDPVRAFERRWALALVDRVLDLLEAENAEGQRNRRFRTLRPLLLGDPVDASYAELAQALGMTEGAVKVAVLRLRQRYRELFRAEVAQVVGGEDGVEDEMRHVVEVLSQP